LRAIDDFPKGLQLPSPHFALFLAWDARGVPGPTVVELAAIVLDRGLAYLCAWGPDCERVHDLFDEVGSRRDPGATEETVIMTTWHEDESLDESLWYFLNCALPAEAYLNSCKSWLAVCVGNDEWARTIEMRLANPENL